MNHLPAPMQQRCQFLIYRTLIFVVHFRADQERILRDKVRLHAEHMRERRARPADNPVDDMRSAQRELEIVSLLFLLTFLMISQYC